MKILQFEGDDIHGYLTRRIHFFDDITFITGINGSGKTTIINALIALLTPSLVVLAELNYRALEVRYENDGKQGFIRAEKSGSAIALSVSGANEPFVFGCYIPSEDLPRSRDREREQDYYRELVAVNSNHPVLNLIDDLPTPMFLDLQRRARFLLDQAGTSFAPARAYRPSRNVFSASLIASLDEAASLAERNYRTTAVAVSNLGEELRRELVLQMLPVEESVDYGTLTVPTDQDLRDIKSMRQVAESLPRILNLPREEVLKRVIAFLDLLDKYASEVPRDKSRQQILKNIKGNEPYIKALLGWSLNNPQLAKFRDITRRVDMYNSERKKLTHTTDRYLALVNTFLQDSGKQVVFNERGDIAIMISGLLGERSTSSFSSGEAQIFVILTQLLFNPNAQRANVFVIDEPELSLHVQWQELFVDSVIGANPKVQYIMATHSPSIILERVNRCRDLGPQIAARV